MIKNTTQSGQISSKPRIIKVFRSRPKKNQCHHLSIPDTRFNTTIHTSIGLSNSRTGIIDNRIKSIIGDNSIEKSKNRIYSILGNKTSGSLHSHSHPFRNQVGNDNGTNDLNTTFEKPSEPAEVEENNDVLKKNTKESASKVNNYQNIRYNTIDTGNRSNLQMTDVVPRRLNLSTRSNIEHRKKNEKRREIACNYCRCSRLCMFLSAVAAILFLTAIAAAVLTSLLNKSNTTTTTTTATTTTLTTTTVTTDTTTTITTATTTITYVPTGIYALQIPTCATWNQTGITVAGNANGTAGIDLGSLYNNAGIFVDNNYTLYVSDRDNDRIMKYVTNSTTGIVVAGTGLQGSGPTELNQPKGVAVDQMGALIVADSSNYRIQRFPLGSFVGTTIASNSSTNLLGQIRDLHIDVNNGIYVTDSDYSRIVKYVPNDAIGVILAGINGSGSAANQFLQPFGNFIDGNQTLYVADDGNSRVQMWLSGATSGSTVAGVTNSSGSSLTQLNAPLAVIVDNNGYIYIVDQGNNRIIRWTTNYAAGGTCIVGCTGSAGVAATQLMNPRDLKFDASGNLYVSDQGNNRVQKFMILISPNCTATSSG